LIARSRSVAHLVVRVVALCLLPATAMGSDAVSDETVRSVEGSVVQIVTPSYDEKSTDDYVVQGAGFIVTDRGFILTASEILDDMNVTEHGSVLVRLHESVRDDKKGILSTTVI
jgi:hypothetical protein